MSLGLGPNTEKGVCWLDYNQTGGASHICYKATYRMYMSIKVKLFIFIKVEEKVAQQEKRRVD